MAKRKQTPKQRTILTGFTPSIEAEPQQRLAASKVLYESITGLTDSYSVLLVIDDLYWWDNNQMKYGWEAVEVEHLAYDCLVRIGRKYAREYDTNLPFIMKRSSIRLRIQWLLFAIDFIADKAKQADTENINAVLARAAKAKRKPNKFTAEQNLLAVLATNPDCCSVKKLARLAGVNRTTAYRCEKFKAAFLTVKANKKGERYSYDDSRD